METILSVRIDQKMKDQLTQLSKRLGRPFSDIVRDALKRQLDVETFRNLRSQLLPYGENAGLLTDEDVFNEVS